MLYPLTFRPIFKERVWGGRNLERLYNKSLPPRVPIGESWEISDRPGDVSIIATGPLAGKDLHWLMDNHRADVLGSAAVLHGRFPLLVKILDAQQKLSLQVHPPASKAARLGGEPKTEMWYITHASPGAELFVGLKRGVDRAEFERRIQSGGIADCFHRIKVGPGDAMFLPSGRVHAIGSGLVLFEIQQNSDTTYRVYDWDRVGLDGKPRALHIAESLDSINFDDFEPAIMHTRFEAGAKFETQPLVRDPLFTVEVCRLNAGERIALAARKMHIVAVLTGALEAGDSGESIGLSPGEFCLFPASLEKASLVARAPATFLRIEAGQGGQ
jgi:mannose-6-phosphate isomerase